MKKLMLVAGLALGILGGCTANAATANEPTWWRYERRYINNTGGDHGVTLARIHDDEIMVTCWITGFNRAISCIPDKAL